MNTTISLLPSGGWFSDGLVILWDFFPTNDDFLIFFLPLLGPDWLTEVNNRWRAHKVLALFTNILCFWGERFAQGRTAPNCSSTTELCLETIIMVVISHNPACLPAVVERVTHWPDNSWNWSWHQRKFHWVGSLYLPLCCIALHQIVNLYK